MEKLRQQTGLGNYRMIPCCLRRWVRMVVSGGTGSDFVLPLQARVHTFLRAGHWPGLDLLIISLKATNVQILIENFPQTLNIMTNNLWLCFRILVISFQAHIWHGIEERFNNLHCFATWVQSTENTFYDSINKMSSYERCAQLLNNITKETKSSLV